MEYIIETTKGGIIKMNHLDYQNMKKSKKILEEEID